MKKKTIKIPIYGGKWTIIICDSIKEVENLYGLEPTDGYDALCMSRFVSGEMQFITAFENDTPGIIAHECVHLINRIFEVNGVKPDLDNDEHQAYMMGWAVNRVHEFKDKVKK